MPRTNLSNGKRALTLQWPMSGLDKRFDYQFQPPYTTPLVSNMWPTTPGTGRQQGSTRPGLSKIAGSAASEPGGGASHPVQMLTTTTYISSNAIVSKLLKIMNGTLYTFDDTTHAFSAVVSGLSFHTTKTLQAADRNQKVYIADHDDNPTISNAARVPKIYDPSAGTIVSWAAAVTDGTMPTGCPLVCLWRDRLILSGGTTTPYGVYGSRQGDPLDWDYSETDDAAAWDLGASQAGLIGQTVTALIPHADNCILIACPNSVWILRGDPRYGGQLGNISKRIGIISKNAWCFTPDGLVVFLSKDGLYAIPAGCNAGENSDISLSRERMPIALLDIDASTYEASLCYDERHRGIHIFVTDTANLASGQHFFFDWQLKSFWPVSFGTSAYDPYCCHERQNFSSQRESHCVFGCRDGYTRRYLTSQSDTDDGTTLESSIYLGPFGDSGLLLDTRLDTLNLTVEGVSVNWAIYAGDTPQEAVNNTAASADGNLPDSASLDTGLRHKTLTPRVRGASMYLALSSTLAWQFVSGTIILSPCGKTRV